MTYLRRENVITCIESEMCLNNPNKNRVNSRRSCWSDAHCHGPSLITASDNGNVVCSVSWIRMADTLNTRLYCLYCKIIVVTDVVLKYFLEQGLQHDFLCKLSAWIRRVDTRGAVIKIKLASRHLLLSIRSTPKSRPNNIWVRCPSVHSVHKKFFRFR